jgi:hypothetical protein
MDGVSPGGRPGGVHKLQQPVTEPSPGQPPPRWIASVFFCHVLWFSGFFNLHVAEFLGVKDLATLQALDKLCVFVPGNDSYPGMLAGGCHRLWIR